MVTHGPALEYYYHDARTEQGVESDAPGFAPLEAILEIWDSLSHESGTFLGIVCPVGVSLQFMWDEPDVIQLDIPVPERKGSWCKEATFTECREALVSAGKGADPREIPGLEFQAWGGDVLE
ncbi:MAG: hypothetical protein WD045_07060 [Pirellulaceae bacterium]